MCKKLDTDEEWFVPWTDASDQRYGPIKIDTKWTASKNNASFIRRPSFQKGGDVDYVKSAVEAFPIKQTEGNRDKLNKGLSLTRKSRM